MAPYIPIPGTLQANIRFLLDGQHIESCLCFRYEGTPFNTAVLAVHTSLEAVWWATIRAYLSNSLVSQETYYVDLSSESGPVSTQPPFINPAGAHAGQPVPNNCALCITHRTTNRGRSYRGRTFVPAIGNDQVVVNRVVPAGVTNTVLAFNALRADLDVSGIQFVIASREHNGAHRVVGLATAVELSVALDNVIDSTRRRLPGRGT